VTNHPEPRPDYATPECPFRCGGMVLSEDPTNGPTDTRCRIQCEVCHAATPWFQSLETALKVYNGMAVAKELGLKPGKDLPL
jgi:hypothetical protein